MTNQIELLFTVDMDGTLVDFISGWKKRWNEKYTDRMITTDPTEFELEVAYSNYGTDKEIKEIIYTPGFFFHLEPLPGAIEAFKQMADCGIELFICSSPTSLSTSWMEKADWIEVHLGKEWVNRLILTRDKTLIQSDYLIDDKPNITGIYHPCWEHVVFDTTYNRGEDTKDKKRITWQNWPSLLLLHAQEHRK